MRNPPSSCRRRRLLYLVFGILAVTVTLYSGFLVSSPGRRRDLPTETAASPEKPEHQVDRLIAEWEADKDNERFDPASYLLGPPTQSFRDNLRNDTKYITSFHSAGWTNDVMTMANLIYLAKISDRIPIIPNFTPEYHVGGPDVERIPFSEVFDVPRLSKAIDLPILEWHQVKDTESEEIEELGCWSVWASVSRPPEGPRGSRVPSDLGLDISYTPVPDWVPSGHNSHTTFWKLAPLTFPATRAKNLGKPIPSPEKGVVVHPDEQLACFDYLYYVAAHEDFEYELEFSPAWRHVLYHFRWTPTIQNLAIYYLRRALKVAPGADIVIPPYIAIHARHGDFGISCKETPASIKCFAPVSSFAQAVAEVQREILERDGIVIPNEHVVMTSDEKDPEWWDLVASYGFTWVDYKKENVVEILGRWYPTFIDAVIQSGGRGFVGCEQSTMSLIAGRRVREWHGGITKFIPWGPASP